MLKRLVKEHGFAGTYSTAKRYVKRKKDMDEKVSGDGYLPISQPPAHVQMMAKSVAKIASL
jgi:hypothetical protein